MGNKALDYTALTIAIIGAVNWGLVGFFNFNLVSFLFGSMSWISRIVYALVGICGLYLDVYKRQVFAILYGKRLSAGMPFLSVTHLRWVLVPSLQFVLLL